MFPKRGLPFIIIATLTISIVFIALIPLGIPQTSSNFVLPCTIATFGNAWEGELAFGLWQFGPGGAPNGSYLVVMGTNGTVEFLRQTNDASYGVVKNIAQDTLMFQGEPVLGGSNTAPIQETHFWNYVDGTTVDFPNVIGHHDIEYNPVNNTFLTLQD